MLRLVSFLAYHTKMQCIFSYIVWKLVVTESALDAETTLNLSQKLVAE